MVVSGLQPFFTAFNLPKPQVSRVYHPVSAGGDTVLFAGKLSETRKIRIATLCRTLKIPAPRDNRAYTLINRALTTPAMVKSRLDSNQRLEFLGDAVLSTVTRQYLMRRFGRSNEGPMSQLAHTLNCNQALAEMGKRIGLTEYMRLPADFYNRPEKGRNSMIADAMEALLGALFLSYDGDTRVAYEMMHPLLRDLLKDIPEELYGQTNYDIGQVAHDLWGPKAGKSKGNS